MNNSKKEPGFFNQLTSADILIQSGLLTAYIGGLLFVTGWSYADRYFAIFGINISSVDRNVEGAFYIYALWALKDGLIFLIAVVLGLILIGAIIYLLKLKGRPWRTPSVFLLALFVVLSFLGAFLLGEWRADSQVPKLLNENYHTFPRIIIHPKKDSATEAFLKSKSTSDTNTCLRKIFQDQKTLYVYPGYESYLGRIPPVYAIPMDQLGAIEIIRNRGLCKP